MHIYMYIYIHIHVTKIAHIHLCLHIYVQIHIYIVAGWVFGRRRSGGGDDPSGEMNQDKISVKIRC